MLPFFSRGALYFLLYFWLTQSLLANPTYSPWFTGPLIVPSGKTLNKGVLNIQTYIFTNVVTGYYDESWHEHCAPNIYQINLSPFFRYGITDWFDVLAITQVYYNSSQGRSSFEFGDFQVGCEFQIYPPNHNSYIPGIKFRIKEILPTGRFDNLITGDLGVDIGGFGTYGTYLNLLFYNQYIIKNLHYLNSFLSFSYTFNSNVEVREFNAFGGGIGTRGIVSPGSEFSAIFSFEYSLNQNWAIALDNVYLHRNESKFKGFPGRAINGNLASIGLPSSEEISFSPAIEYNFSENCGIIAGVWFTAYGRNTPVFRSGVISFNYTFKP